MVQIHSNPFIKKIRFKVFSFYTVSYIFPLILITKETVKPEEELLLTEDGTFDEGMLFYL